MNVIFAILLISLFGAGNSPCPCLNQSDAERILGEFATKSDAVVRNQRALRTFTCTYTADEDPVTRKTGHLFYHLATYRNADAAHKEFKSLQAGNAGQAGQENLTGLGDEAWWHSDGSNFMLVIVRKGSSLLRLKVNKVTARTSKAELLKVASELPIE